MITVPRLIVLTVGMILLIYGALWFFTKKEIRLMPNKSQRVYDLNLTPEADQENINLQGRDLSHMDLHGINLKNANLRYCNLFDTNLEGANLTGAQVDGANFTSANLRYANLSYVDLRHIDMIEVKLEGVNLEHAIWRGGKECAKGSFGKCL